jgi:uncharacterized protein with HEPN domain
MGPDDGGAGYFLDMLQHPQGVVRAIRGRTLEDHVEDEDLRLLVERRPEIIDEAGRRVSEAFRSAHPEIPWPKTIAQRKVLAHEYGEIHDDVLWQVATVSTPELITAPEPLVAPVPPKPHGSL